MIMKWMRIMNAKDIFDRALVVKVAMDDLILDNICMFCNESPAYKGWCERCAEVSDDEWNDRDD